MKSIKIYFTSDTHGYLFPISYATNHVSNSGLLAITNQYQKDGNTLIIDGGDTIQGSPYTMYLHKYYQDASLIADVLNKGHYDYITLGNHDFNYGQDYLKSYLNNFKGQCLLANIHLDNLDLPIQPYTIKTLENGLKVGIIGLTTDYIPNWENSENLIGITFSDPYTKALELLNTIKNQVDLTIGIYHGGFESDIHTGQVLSHTTENVGYKIAHDLTFDILLTGHQHMSIAQESINGTHIVQTPHNGAKYVEITIDWDNKNIQSVLKGPSSDYNQALYPQQVEVEKKVQSFLDEVVGQLPHAIQPNSHLEMALHGSEIANLINQVQLDISQADLSCTALANEVKGFNKQVTIRDIVSTYPYANTLVVKEINGNQLKQALERTASYIDLDSNNQPFISPLFTKPKVEHYNYDYFDNITFDVDVNKPINERVSNILYQNKPISDDQTFTLVMNSYRATGAGGYDVYNDCPTVKEINLDMSEILINYFENNKNISLSDHNNINYIY